LWVVKSISVGDAIALSGTERETTAKLEASALDEAFIPRHCSSREHGSQESGLLGSYGEVKLVVGRTQECVLNIEIMVCAGMKWNEGWLLVETPVVGMLRKKGWSLERNPLVENSVIAEC
jgi:hypothetical protein